MDTDTALSPPTEPSAYALIASAIDRGVPPDQMQTLYAIYREELTRKAEEAFNNALANFQRDCPFIAKTRKGQAAYKFANFDDVMEIAKPHLSHHCIRVSVTTPELIGDTKMLRYVVHLAVGSYTKEYPSVYPMPDVDALVDKLKVINTAQAYRQYQTLCKRYAVCDALGITVVGEETMERVNGGAISQEQEEVLKAIIDADALIGFPCNFPRFYKWLSEVAGFEIKALAELPAKHFGHVKAEMDENHAKKEQKAKVKK